MDRACPPGGADAVPAAGVFDRGPGVELLRQRLQRGVRRAELQFAAAHALPAGRRVGRPRRLAAALAVHARRLDLRRRAALEVAGRRDGRARARRARARCRRPAAVRAAHVEPVHAPDPGPRRGPRPEPAAAGPGPGRPSAPPVHGLRRLLGRVRIRHRRAHLGAARRRVGALVASVDDHGLDVPHLRHRAGFDLGLLRTGLAGGSGTRSRTPRSCPG
jgi:hypothetical protein